MRILLVTRAYDPAVLYGGPVASIGNAARGVAGAGHRVAVACTNMAGPGSRGPLLPHGLRAVEGVDVHYLRTPIRFHWDGFSPEASSVLRARVAEADVLHVFGTRHYLGSLSVGLARRRGVPWLITPEGSVPARGRSVAAKRMFDRVVTRRSLGEAFRILSASADETRDLVDWGIPPHRIALVRPQGPPLPPTTTPSAELRRRYGIPASHRIVLWLGRIHPDKGLPTLVEALADPRLADTWLVLGGAEEPGGRLVEALRRQAAAAGISERVCFPGWLGLQEKADLLGASSLFVLPSRRESFGLAAVEALSAGVPVVVTRGCGVASTIGGRAGVVCEPTARSLNQAIRHALADGPGLEAMRRACPEIAGALSGPPASATLEALYRQAVRSPMAIDRGVASAPSPRGR